MENTDENINQTPIAEENNSNTEETSVETNQSENVEDATSQTIDETVDSGDENNAQVEDTKQTNDEEPKSFDDLQEERKTLWQQEKERAVQIESQMQNQVYGQTALTPQQQLEQWGYTANDLKTSRLEQEFLWDKAYTKHPELQSDGELDQLVYANYVARRNAGEDVTPLKVADEVVKFIEKRTSKVKEATYKQAEDDISSKMVVSPKNPKRSPGGRGETSMSELKQRARQGDENAVNELLQRV